MINKKVILVMGLPGSGKTKLASDLKTYLKEKNKTIEWFNADIVRKKFDDWDFSYDGRIRQSERMKILSQESKTDFVICDFIAPLKKMRDILSPDWIIWVDTIDEGRYEDTNKMFDKPEDYDFRIPEKNSKFWSSYIGEKIINNKKRPVFDQNKETVQLLGRWQPWHLGHRTLFEKALEKTGQVVIMIRSCQGWNNSNPFNPKEITDFIKKDLDPLYQGQYKIIVVPNIVNITYGRNVGYKIEEEILSEEIQKISATEIREKGNF